ncbi:MAG: hypothetical protein JWO31_415 [Phycisphaerales bacterium]|nr:hypothetical protein [Phycisphaerales bacterium]
MIAVAAAEAVLVVLTYPLVSLPPFAAFVAGVAVVGTLGLQRAAGDGQWLARATGLSSATAAGGWLAGTLWAANTFGT